ncbi:MAG: MotA/TolQ/ExbB proton channel family protein [Planctomycetota bacterium]|jgi:biopolymer transport protein ExbB
MFENGKYAKILSAVMVVFACTFLTASFAVIAGEEAAAETTAAADSAAAPAAGAEGDKAAEGGGDGEIPDTVLGLLWNSGLCGYIIIVLSVVLLALSIKTFFEFKPDKLMPEDVLEDLENALDQGEYEQALEICQTEDVFLTRIVGAGLGKMANGFTRMEEAIAEEAEAQATLLHQTLGYINLIATIAPMLGLLGTVSGMVTAFGTIARNPMATAQQLAGGIYVALTTTLLGLVVAIPGTIIFTFLRNRTIKSIMDMGVINGEILDRFRVEE